ncbi:zinc ribbon domain-containing protein [Saccharospirillum mangrovi]|uniref:zinc ribbon domain-containing protein n=1 Tax=Saccharospirillum mangrovi TaxID=2161747 RepID=UPI000D398B73|nr:zinc ribbon domain-containing protein [Saccharospirillum mangrovi]
MKNQCQSCGMPMKGKPDLAGTEVDGRKSALYCHYCYQDGAFTQPTFTVEEMQQFCIARMKEQGFPALLAWLFVRKLPKLKRWSEAGA